MSKTLNILGAGGHAKVAVDCAIQSGFDRIFVFDENKALIGKQLLGITIQDFSTAQLDKNDLWFLAIGDNKTRSTVSKKFPANTNFVSLIHPSAITSAHLSIGSGTLVCPGAVINADSKIGNHVIINSNSTIEHDCEIGDFAHICPGSSLAGAVKIGEGTLIGIGSSVLPGLSVHSWSVIGAGSVVVKSFEQQVTAYGNPAVAK